MRILPHANRAVPIALDVQLREDERAEDHVLRLGSDAKQAGIVSALDPRLPTTPDLRVTVNPNDTLRLEPGRCYTAAGAPVAVTETLDGLTLPDLTPGSVFVVILRYHLVDSPTVVPDLYGQTLTEGREVAPLRDMIEILSSLDWAQAPPDDNAVFLARTFVTNDSNNPITVDLSERKWFSQLDYDHRSRFGSGTVTPANPHGLSPGDLSEGPWTVYGLMAQETGILAFDEAAFGVPGYACIHEIPATAVLVDATGDVTGYVNAAYVTLPRYPLTLGRAADDTGDIPATLIPGTPIVAFPSLDNPGILPTGTIRITAAVADAGEPTVALGASPVPSVTFRQPRPEERVVSGYTAHQTIEDPIVQFSDVGEFPRPYRFFVNGDGALLQSPFPILCTTFLSTMTGPLAPTDPLPGTAFLSLGLARAVDSPTLSVRVRIVGLDHTGASHNEILSFGAPWTPLPSIPYDDLHQPMFQVSTKMFSSVESIELIESIDAGPNARIAVWAEINGRDSDTLNRAHRIGVGQWNGFGLVNYKDHRTVRATGTLRAGYGSTISLTSQQIGTVIGEQFLNPQIAQFDVEDGRSLHVKQLAAGGFNTGRSGTTGHSGLYLSRYVPTNRADTIVRADIYLLSTANGRYSPIGLRHLVTGTELGAGIQRPDRILINTFIGPNFRSDFTVLEDLAASPSGFRWSRAGLNLNVDGIGVRIEGGHGISGFVLLLTV